MANAARREPRRTIHPARPARSKARPSSRRIAFAGPPRPLLSTHAVPEATLTADDRAALDDSLRRLLARRCGEADVRRIMETPEGFDRGLHAELAAVGVLGLVIPPEHGGAGAGAIELEAMMETLGAALLPGPLLSSSVFAARLLLAVGDEAASARWLPPIAAGRAIATVAVTRPGGRWRAGDVGLAADAEARLTGEAAYVPHAGAADLILAVANGADGPAIFEVAQGARGLSVQPRETFDRTLRLATVRFAATPARRLAAADRAWNAVEQALAWTQVALAGEQAGAARRVLDTTVAYAKTRRQFGRPIGAFQAIKHMAADLLVETESATSAAREAARALDQEGPTAAAIPLAAFTCAEAFVQVAATAIQMHGGIAFTWDHPCHLYLRRARADAELFGHPDSHRERWLAMLEAAS